MTMNRNLALWSGVLLGPVAWLAAFETDFALAPWACASRSKSLLYAVWLVALTITAGAGITAWRQWRALGGEAPGDGGAVSRERLMAMSGVLLSGLMFLVIVAQAIPAVILEACQ